jgi:hypothetical protein
MGRFQSTVSTVAALASIFAAGAAGWKLASESTQPPIERTEEPKAEVQDTVMAPAVTPEVTHEVEAPPPIESITTPQPAPPGPPPVIPPPPVEPQTNSESGT